MLSRPVRLALVVLALVALPALAFAQAKEERISKAPAGSPEAIVEKALNAARKADFDAYIALVHPDHRSNEDQVAQRKRYEWARFLKQASWYLVEENPLTFVVVRRQPDEAAGTYKIFLKDQLHKDRMPVPVLLKRHGSEWTIQMNSL